MPMPKRRPGPDLCLALALVLVLGVGAGGCGTAGEAVRPPGPEADLYSRLYQLSRAVQARDADRVASFYAPGATSVTPEQPYRSDAGSAAIRATAEGAFARVRTLRVILSDAVQVRPEGARIATVQGVHAEWETTDGYRWAWDGRHAAVWESREGRLLIVHEELLGSPLLLTIPATGGIGLVPLPAESPAPPEDPGPTPAPESAPEASVPAGRTEPPKSAPAAPAQARAPAFSTPDWAGDPVFVVHFGSFKERKLAEAHAAGLLKETGLPARAVRVELGEKGTWFRSVVGEFPALPEALSAREALLRKGRAGVGFVYQMTAGR